MLQILTLSACSHIDTHTKHLNRHPEILSSSLIFQRDKCLCPAEAETWSHSLLTHDWSGTAKTLSLILCPQQIKILKASWVASAMCDMVRNVQMSVCHDAKLPVRWG